MFLATNPGSILGVQIFKDLFKFFVAKIKKTSVVMSQKLLCRLCID